MTVPAKPHAVITASDAHCGDFLVRHWLPSLLANADLSQIDVVVLDLGLTQTQRSALDGARCVEFCGSEPAKIRRYRGLARFLERSEYDQVLTVDAGDVVFQRDVSPLFVAGADRMRALVERSPVPLWPFLRGMPSHLRHTVRARLRGRPTINSGVLLGPADRLRQLGEILAGRAASIQHDQPIVNCVLRDWGFESLDETWNFVLWTTRDRFRVEGGIFRHSHGGRIGLVHNTGLRGAFRLVADFGYGPGYNRRIRTAYRGVASAWQALSRKPVELSSQ